VDETTQCPALLDADSRFALMQLCSTAYLSAGALNEGGCARLERDRLACRDRDGYWRATADGKAAFARMEDLRRQSNRIGDPSLA